VADYLCCRLVTVRSYDGDRVENSSLVAIDVTWRPSSVRFLATQRRHDATPFSNGEYPAVKIF
jgi:hypothetical protein